MNPNNRKSHTNSMVENEPTGDSSILSGNQVPTFVVKINCPSQRITLDNKEGKSNKSEITDFEKPKKTKRRNTKLHRMLTDA